MNRKIVSIVAVGYVMALCACPITLINDTDALITVVNYNLSPDQIGRKMILKEGFETTFGLKDRKEVFSVRKGGESFVKKVEQKLCKKTEHRIVLTVSSLLNGAIAPEYKELFVINTVQENT